MTADTEANTTSDSEKPRSSLLARCGLHLSALAVRDRNASEGDPNRPVMTLANRDKKRKRTAHSPLPASRTAFKMTGTEKKEVTQEEARAAFLAALKVEMPDMDPVLLKMPEEMSNKEKEEKNFREGTGEELPAEKEATQKTSDPTPGQEYYKRRQKLLDSEAIQSWDYEASTIDVSAAEKRAAVIIRAIREFERKHVFGNNASEAIPGPETRDMGGKFLTNKMRIESRSKLFEIAKEVPKGAILHLHFNAELNPERLLLEARSMENMYVWSIRPLTEPADLGVTEMVFNILPHDTPSNDIFSPEYTGRKTDDGKDNWKLPECQRHVWMRWSEFRKRFPVVFPRLYIQTRAEEATNAKARTCSEPAEVHLDQAENWIKSKMVISEEEAYGPAQTVNGVWARFNQATRCFKGLLNYERVYKWYIRKAIDRLIDEKIMYAELRPMLMDKSIPADNGIDTIDNFAQMRMIEEAVEEKKTELKNAKKEHLFPFGLKIIYCTPRSIPRPKMRMEMRDCIDLKIGFRNLICGFDLVGAEDRPNPIGFYYEELVAFQETCKKIGIEIPFLFHAGETLLDTGGTTDPGNSNLYDAVLLKSKRIGHGFSLMKHPELIKYFKMGREGEPGPDGKKLKADNPGICIELCPISNELLHLCRNIKEHPYPELLAQKIPCTVNSDNPSLFSNSMSHEFYQIMVGAPTMSIHSWKQLALWSLEYSCLEPGQKVTGKGYFRKAWEQFCEQVVEKYGVLMAGDEIDESVAARAYAV